ncbi:MAG: Cyclohexadienyl dehydrogenase [Paracidovorax wautersii]|uniref:Cyclohexadienyl dehydrogenase n=1 Tax=Paracidovorax wautersii TaxID=1177982 RepID=A0A7V8JPG6_9BURK|nr:MAG: Cyclohexadienyl dehydrogenase [Paracidovorax wautersii]
MRSAAMSEPAASASSLPFQRVAIIGCGLMGGSLALALRAAGRAGHITGYSTTPASLQAALDQGVIDQAATSAAQAAQGADLVVLAVPVGAMAPSFAAIAPVLAPGALVIDVGSTKSDVIAAARAHLGPRLPDFVPCHPIAGKEKAGSAAASATLYRDRRAVVTPLPENPSAQVARATSLWRAVGCEVVTMDAAQHDTAFAAVSHLPHLLAFAYVNGLLDQPDGAAFMAAGGPGFRDFSRIAGSEPAMWRDVLLANRDQVLAQSHAFRQALDQIEADLRAGAGDALAARIQQASDARAAWVLGGPGNTSPHDG